MARKRLSDLLREEVQKGDAVPVVEAAQVPAKPASKRQKAATPSRKPTSNGTKATVAEPVEAEILEVETPSELSNAKAALERSQQREAALKQENSALQQELDRKEAQIHSLQADLEKAQSFRTELDKAKQDALHLAEENSRLVAELQSLKEQTPKTTPVQAKPAPVEAAPPPAESALTPSERLRRQQIRSLAHPVFPAGSSPGQLSDLDLGWVD
jgi:DNA repair exonuclease SbcCD ATPase subunit